MSAETFEAAVFREGAANAAMERITVSGLRPDEVLVRLVATGVCHTDLTCRDGFMAMPRPIVLGHEGAGTIVRIGSAVRSVKSGDRVVLTFLPCGTCPNCLEGVPAYCFQFMAGNLTGRRADGSTALTSAQGDVSGHFFGQSSFATHSVANERNVIRVRDDAPLELLGPLGCGVQTGAGCIMNVLKPSRGESLAVFGGGGVGLSAVMAAVVEGLHPIIVIEPRAERRQLALEVGAHHVLDPGQGADVPGQLQAIAPAGIRNAVDTSGIPEVIGQAIAALSPRGRIAIVSTNKLEAVLPVPLIALLGRGITVRGVNMGDSVPRSFIPKLVDLIVEGRFPLHKLVRFYPFAELNQALEDQHHGHAVKPILRMPA